MDVAMIRLMVGNVVGRRQHVDLSVLATQPHVAGGAHINRTSDYWGGRR